MTRMWWVILEQFIVCDVKRQQPAEHKAEPQNRRATLQRAGWTVSLPNPSSVRQLSWAAYKMGEMERARGHLQKGTMCFKTWVT